MQLEQAVEYILKKTSQSGVDQADVVASEGKETSLEMFESRVKSLDISSSRGLGIRLFKQNRPGFAFTEDLSENSLNQMLKDALAHTEITDEVQLTLPANEPLPAIDLKQHNPELEQTGVDLLKKISLELETKAKAIDERVSNVPYLGAGFSSGRSILANTNGIFYSRNKSSIDAGLGVMAATRKNPQAQKLGYYVKSGRSHDIFDTSQMAQTAVERATELLSARPVESGKYPVVFSNRVAPMVFSLFSSVFYADSVQKGMSRLKGRMGEQIGSEKVNLRCLPHRDDLPGSRLFDSEGVLTSDLDVIENGRLNHFLYNLEAAAKEKVSSTGHGSRGYSGKASTGFHNMVVDTGSLKLDELLKAYDRMLYIVKLEGASGCSAVSGEISIGAQGFLMESAEKVHAVDGITLSTNFFDLLPAIEAFSDEYSDSFSSVKVPDFLVPEIYVAG